MKISEKELADRLILIKKSARKYQKKRRTNIQEHKIDRVGMLIDIIDFKHDHVPYFDMSEREKNHILGD